ncbi:MAG: histidine--tRNA ligase [Chloroflexota bacterium]
MPSARTFTIQDMPSFTSPSGFADILPQDWPYWQFVLDAAVKVSHLFRYQRIETPILGPTGLFARSSGQGTDVVDKEMYSFRDRGGDEVSLRPEGTAPVMRAYFEHGMETLPQPVKLYYIERMYRYDRPQKGRFREHRQFGCEAIGSEEPYVDVEMMALLKMFYHRIGLTDLSLQLNSIGDGDCRPAYLRALVPYLREHTDDLAPLDRERIDRNPLRVLDSKEAASQEVIRGAPRMTDFLCEACRAHFHSVLHGLDLLDIPYTLNNRLVRGLDYYTRTVFEFHPPGHGAQSSVGAGGRYDALSEAMGEKPVPGIGFGSGLERLVLNVRERGIEVPAEPGPEVVIIHAGSEAGDSALVLANQLRAQNIATDMSFGPRSLKAQMKRANSSGARFAAIIGDEELQSGEVTLRDLQKSEQERIPRAALAGAVSPDQR